MENQCLTLQKNCTLTEKLWVIKALGLNCWWNCLNHLLSWFLGFPQIFLPENPNDLCDRLEILPQEKQAGNKTDIVNEEIIAMANILLEYRCISTKKLRCLNA